MSTHIQTLYGRQLYGKGEVLYSTTAIPITGTETFTDDSVAPADATIEKTVNKPLPDSIEPTDDRPIFTFIKALSDLPKLKEWLSINLKKRDIWRNFNKGGKP